MKSQDDPLILVAAISGAFGVRGELRVKSFTADPLACANYGPLRDESGTEILTPIKAREIKNGVALTAQGITTPEDANALKSTALYVHRSALPAELEDDEYYVTDLIGMDVKSVDGKRLGIVKDVQDFGAGDVLEITPAQGASWFHPFTQADVPKVDIAKRRIIIVPPEILPDKTRETDTAKDDA